MPVKIDMDGVLARRKLKAKQVAQQVGISETQFSLFRSGKIKGVRFATLARLCAVLQCELSEIMTYEFSTDDLALPPVDEEGE